MLTLSNIMNDQIEAQKNESKSHGNRFNYHFPEKIYLILESESSDIIRWENNGSVFRIVDQKRLEAEILPRWFKHCHISSVQRQLNLYGFKCVSRGGDVKGTFYHPLFKQGGWSEVSRIRRAKTVRGPKQSKAKAPAVIENSEEEEDEEPPSLDSDSNIHIEQTIVEVMKRIPSFDSWYSFHSENNFVAPLPPVVDQYAYHHHQRHTEVSGVGHPNLTMTQGTFREQTPDIESSHIYPSCKKVNSVCNFSTILTVNSIEDLVNYCSDLDREDIFEFFSSF